jgi:ribonuclease VapC
MSRAIAVDTSVIMAVCLQETGYNAYEDLLETTSELLMSAVTRVELGIVCAARSMSEKADLIVRTYGIEIIPFDEVMALAAIEAFERYGKGRHNAALNFGDCCSYALAKTRGIALLYQGADFALTDVVSALA